MQDERTERDARQLSTARQSLPAAAPARHNPLATGVRRLAGWRRTLLALGTGAVSTLALAPLHLWPVMFATLPVVVWLLDGIMLRAPTWRDRLLGAAGLGWWFGFGYFFASLYWVGFAFFVQAERFAWMSPLGILIMPAGLALFYALGLAIASAVWRPGPARIFTLALAFFMVELLRGHILTGFPWNTIGYTLAAPDTLMQAGALVGVYGLSFFAVLIFAAPATLTDQTGRALRYLMPALAALLLVGMAGWGWWRLAQPLPPDVAGPKLRIVQADIPQADKWNPDARDWIFERYLRLSRGGASLADDVTHVIWPEAALPFVYLFDEDISKESHRKAFDRLLPAGATLITGANRAETVNNDGGERIVSAVYNSVLALDDRGEVIATADKSHLVPFGEYLPFQDALEKIGLRQLTNLPGGFAAGGGISNLDLAGLPRFTPLICYEIIFPRAVRPDEHPAWLLNLTDDSWFGETAGPYQHLHQARMRAVEEGLPVIRAANTGISAVIGPRGELREWLALGGMGVIDTRLPPGVAPPPYARSGAVVPVAIFLAAIGLALALYFLTPSSLRRHSA
jgi:apolipoprotein N-acyltransferase